jgi:hypothetical protein
VRATTQLPTTEAEHTIDKLYLIYGYPKLRGVVKADALAVMNDPKWHEAQTGRKKHSRKG